MISVRGMALVCLVGHKLSGARSIKMWIISIDVRCLMISVLGMALVCMIGYKLSGAWSIKMWIMSIDVSCLMISVLGMALVCLIGYKLSGAWSIKMWIMSIDVTCLYRWQTPMSQSQSDMCHFDRDCDDRIKRTNWVCTASNLLPIVLVPKVQVAGYS